MLDKVELEGADRSEGGVVNLEVAVIVGAEEAKETGAKVA